MLREIKSKNTLERQKGEKDKRHVCQKYKRENIENMKRERKFEQ